MTREEFKKAVVLAESTEELSHVDDSILYGCGLPGFRKVPVTLRMVAKFIRWQAMNLNGEWDSEELACCHAIARHKFELVN